VTASNFALRQLNTLLHEYRKLTAPAEVADSMAKADPRTLTHRLEAAIERLAVPGSVYAEDLAHERRISYESTQSQLRPLVKLATALRDDIGAGWMVSVVEMAHSDTYADYLGQAEGLVGLGYKNPAAVIAGTSLEVQRKALATKHGVSLVASNGGPKKMDAVNAELKAAGVYNALEHKQVTAWLAIRNSAAHGDYGDYDEAAVKGLVEGVGNFAVRHPA